MSYGTARKINSCHTATETSEVSPERGATRAGKDRRSGYLSLIRMGREAQRGGVSMVRVTSQDWWACSNLISCQRQRRRQSRAKRGARRKAGSGEEEPVRDVVGEEDPGTRPLGC